MLFNFENRKVLVTGSGKGIGLVIAKSFLSAGAEVLLLSGKSLATSQTLQKQLQKEFPGKAEVFHQDLLSENSSHNIFRKVSATSGNVDILINNAAIQPSKPIMKLQTNEIREMLEVNLRSPMELSKLFAAQCENIGAIVNIISIEALTPMKNHAHYASAKAGLLQFTKSSALEFASLGIRANAVCPGLIERVGIREEWPSGVGNWESTVPLKRMGTAEDVANATLFLSSDFASFITGTSIVVDGGMECVAGW